jgi:hypothetical protein
LKKLLLFNGFGGESRLIESLLPPGWVCVSPLLPSPESRLSKLAQPFLYQGDYENSESSSSEEEEIIVKRKPKPERIVPRWKYNLASLIDLGIFITALGLPPYYFWFGKSSRSRVTGLGEGFNKKQVAIVGALSIVCIITVWILNSKGAKGTIGERLLEIKKRSED